MLYYEIQVKVVKRVRGQIEPQSRRENINGARGKETSAATTRALPPLKKHVVRRGSMTLARRPPVTTVRGQRPAPPLLLTTGVSPLNGSLLQTSRLITVFFPAERDEYIRACLSLSPYIPVMETTRRRPRYNLPPLKHYLDLVMEYRHIWKYLGTFSGPIP